LSLLNGPLKTALITLVGADQQIDQNDYSDSVEIDLTPAGRRPVSGEIGNVILVSRKTGSGSVMVPDCTIFFFDEDPDIDAGDTAATAAAMQKAIGYVEFENTHWKGDVSGKIAFKEPAQAIMFSNVSSLWAVLLNEDATAINSAAGDDEILELRLHYTVDA
jgi:hypothetical protein